MACIPYIVPYFPPGGSPVWVLPTTPEDNFFNSATPHVLNSPWAWNLIAKYDMIMKGK